MAFSKIILDGTTLIDLTQDTAEEGNVESGYTTHKYDGTQITGTLNTNPDGTDVVFIDYDGSMIAVKSKAEINAMSSDSDLPANPSHEGLTAQGWNWTVAQLKAQLTAMPDQKVYVGQMYITESGATEIDVIMQEGRLSPTLTLAVNGTVTVDWGDNTTPNTVTGTSLTSMTGVGPHTYASAGSYTIKIRVISGQFTFYSDGNNTLLRKNTSRNENRVYANCVQNIRFGSGVASIGNNAFYYCCSLASATISSSVTSIGSSAFAYCYSLAGVTIPSGVTNIDINAFSTCYSLASITIPNSVTSIGTNAFYYCYSLTSVTIPSSVTSIGSSAFAYCYSLAGVTIPSGVTSIGNNAFYNCPSLTSVTIPSSVTSIGSNAFAYCYSLARVAIPSGVTSIGANAFYYCYSLASVTIPSGATSIENYVFSYCYSLASVTIPSGVTSIGTQAFIACYGVSEYHLKPTTPPTLSNTNAFSNIVSDCVIYVPYSEDHSILNNYKTASNWSTYASYMQEELA